MKALKFLGDSLKCLRGFPEDARHDAGYQLDKVQRGEQPVDFKPMPSMCCTLFKRRPRRPAGRTRNSPRSDLSN